MKTHLNVEQYALLGNKNASLLVEKISYDPSQAKVVNETYRRGDGFRHKLFIPVTRNTSLSLITSGGLH